MIGWFRRRQDSRPFPQFCEDGSQRDSVLGIHLKQPRSGPANGRQAKDARAAYDKVVFPPIPARVKQPDDFRRVRIVAGQVCPFVEVALVAGERKVVQSVAAPMLTGNDVLEVKDMETIMFLPQPTVFAALTSPPPNLIAG